jgi:hypothetical protein
VRRLDRHRDAMAVYNHCAEYARLLPFRAELIDIAPPKPEGDLAEVRALIAKVKTTMAQLRSIPPMADEMAAAIKAYVEHTGAQYRPRLTMTGAGPLADFAYVNVVSPLGPFGVACWLFPDLVTERLVSEAGALFGGGTITAEQRTDWTRQSTEALDILERQEEALVEAMLASGQDVERRIDASPAALLQVVVANFAVAA